MPKISEMRHPTHAKRLEAWEKFRLVSIGGRDFIETYLKKFSAYEDSEHFDDRKDITYNPGHSTAVLRLIKNALVQRLPDVQRIGDLVSYQNACSGGDRGVDREGRSMNVFLAEKVIPDLCSIEKVGVMVDMPPLPPTANKLDAAKFRPYLYAVQAEDILNEHIGPDGKLDQLLIRVTAPVRDEHTGLVTGYAPVYKLYTLEAEYNIPESKTHYWVRIRTYYEDDVEKYTEDRVELDEIPFIIPNLGMSLLEDIADYQISALQLASADISYLWRSNFPIYTEQTDPVGNVLRRQMATSSGTAEAASGGISDPTTLAGRVTNVLNEASGLSNGIQVGTTRGRTYSKERPGFIHPSSEPVRASMEKQRVLAEETRQLADLALSSLASKYASGESKKQDKTGQEAGLSYIGTVLQKLENEIARLWAMYENTQPPKVVYPTDYSLRSDAERRAEAKELIELADKIPSSDYRVRLQIQAARVLLSDKLSASEMTAVENQIRALKGSSCDAVSIKSDFELGLVSLETASMLRGYAPGEAEAAKKDHAERIARIQAAQSAGNPAARGNKDGSADPGTHADAEKDPPEDV